MGRRSWVEPGEKRASWLLDPEAKEVKHLSYHMDADHATKTKPEYPRYVAEFLGTFILTLTVTCIKTGGAGNPAAGSILAIASSLMIGIYCVGNVSGAHVNPAVTLAVALSGKQPGGIKATIGYMIVQLIAGLGACLAGGAMFFDGFSNTDSTFATNLPFAPATGHTQTAAGISEFLFTFMLCFTVLNCACANSASGNQYFGLAIGFVIVSGACSVGGISGGAFNPAVAFGCNIAPVIIAGTTPLAVEMVVYWCCELGGAILAALLFRIVRAEDFGRAKNTLFARLSAEFIGTFMLTLTAAFCVVTKQPLAALAIGCTLMIMVYCVGNVSGAALNPAVTFAVLCSGRRKVSARDAVLYMIAQIAAGIGAAVTVFATVSGASAEANVLTHFGVETTPARSQVHACLCELMFTFLLGFTVLSVATSKQPSKDMFGLAIGFVIVVGGFSIGGISGAYLNPAVAVGVEIGNVLYGGTLEMLFIFYFVAQLCGGLLAALVYRAVRPEEYGAKAGQETRVVPVVPVTQSASTASAGSASASLESAVSPDKSDSSSDSS